MNDKLFAFITKYLENRIVSKDKDSKKSQRQWKKLVNKYQLADEFLVLKDQGHKRIVSRSQYYPLMYTFYNDFIAEHLKFKKIL